MRWRTGVGGWSERRLLAGLRDTGTHPMGVMPSSSGRFEQVGGCDTAGWSGLFAWRHGILVRVSLDNLSGEDTDPMPFSRRWHEQVMRFF